MFDLDQSWPTKFVVQTTQPNEGVARHMHVIVLHAPHPDRRLALELLLRTAAIGVVVVLILGLLPAIAQAAA
jgi:hypothetical protein